MQSLMKARPAHVCIAAKRATQYATENGCTLRALLASRGAGPVGCPVRRLRVPGPIGLVGVTA